jgi:hypothetical protein
VHILFRRQNKPVVFRRPPLSLWHIENGAGTFVLLDRPSPPPFSIAYDLRDMLRFVSIGQTAPPPVAPPPGGGAGLSRLPSRKAAYGTTTPLPSLEGEEPGGVFDCLFLFLTNLPLPIASSSGLPRLTFREAVYRMTSSLRL